MSAAIFWTLGYDTIYAHQDKEDDARIGVKSSALALGAAHPALALRVLRRRAAAVGRGRRQRPGLASLFWAGLAGAAVQLAWQAAQVDDRRPGRLPRKFRSNRAVGWLMLAGIVAGHFA